jgi:hypothetical protein
MGYDMMARLVKRLSRAVPYFRRLQDGLAGMRSHIAGLETSLAVLRAQNATLDAAAVEMKKTFEPSLAPSHGPIVGPVRHAVEQSWCDTGGVYLSGWAQAGPHPIRRIVILGRDHRVEADDLAQRVDVIPHYPDLPPTGAAGFEVYLACPHGLPLTIAALTDAGLFESRLVVPISFDDPQPDGTETTERFVRSMLDAGGTVLELGARVVGSMTQTWRHRFEPTCRYLGSDIHPGPGIDVVGDVHALSRSVAPGSLDGVFSIAVLEHLAAPWVAAIEINRCLKLGGETLHITHQTWPVHETPNDYFRMSDQALRSLFGPAHGFEVIECGMAFPVSIVPPTPMRYLAWLKVPLGRGYGQSFIRARKTHDVEASTLWDANHLADLSKAYPQPAAP